MHRSCTLPAVSTLPAVCPGSVLYLQYAQLLCWLDPCRPAVYLAACVDLFTGPVPYLSHLDLWFTWLLVSICWQVNAELEIPPTRVLQLELNPGHWAFLPCDTSLFLRDTWLVTTFLPHEHMNPPSQIKKPTTTNKTQGRSWKWNWIWATGSFLFNMCHCTDIPEQFWWS